MDKLGHVQRKAHDSISQMQANVDLVLERGEVLDHLVEKTEALDASAFKFERSSHKVKTALCWKRVKTYVCLAATLVLLLYAALAFFCDGPGLHNCVSRASSSGASSSGDSSSNAKAATWAPTLMPTSRPTLLPAPAADFAAEQVPMSHKC